MSNLFSTIQFSTSAASLSQLPADDGAEVAFVGRSNAGKSSALNAIANIKKLAKVSNTPGRTQLMNVFAINDSMRLVDLPGYGYAKVPQELKARWQKTLARYLEQRDSLKGLVLLMDCRHPLKEMDQDFLRWSALRALPVHVLLTKSDKLSNSQAAQTLHKTTPAIRLLHPDASVQLFSATHKVGVLDAQRQVCTWLKSMGSNTVKNEHH
jgi:GTP-binding protein